MRDSAVLPAAPFDDDDLLERLYELACKRDDVPEYVLDAARSTFARAGDDRAGA
jgi:hypothetical protein